MHPKIRTRDVFYISDGTAITCQTVGHAVLAQFPLKVNEQTFPFIENGHKVTEVIKEIERSF